MVAHDVLGPSLADAAAVRAWLRACAAAGVSVRVPVVVECGPAGVRMGHARIGTEAGALRADLDDTALGMSLEDHLRGAGASFDGGGGGVAIVDGRWDDDEATLHIVAVDRALGPADALDVGAFGLELPRR
jgi:hypothetical protein